MGRSSSHREEHKESKSHKRSKHEKKHKRSSRDRDKKSDKKSRRKESASSASLLVQRPEEKQLTPLGDVIGHAPDRFLNAEQDYFAFHEHLFVYLYRQEGRAFNDMSSDETHLAFARFVDDYNSGKLPLAYYQDSLPAPVIEECKTTRHKWKFRMSDAEDKSLRTLSIGIKSQTDYREATAASSQPYDGNRGPGDGGGRCAASSSSKRSAADKDEELRTTYGGGLTAEDRYKDRVTNKRLTQHVQVAHEELTGGKPDYGRDRLIEKRKDVADRTHGASRDREEAAELADDTIFGSDTQNFQSALQRERTHAAKRQDKQQQRLAELQQKEEERKQEMMRKLGITPGQKITIKPRDDV